MLSVAASHREKLTVWVLGFQGFAARFWDLLEAAPWLRRLSVKLINEKIRKRPGPTVLRVPRDLTLGLTPQASVTSPCTELGLGPGGH